MHNGVHSPLSSKTGGTPLISPGCPFQTARRAYGQMRSLVWKSENNVQTYPDKARFVDHECRLPFSIAAYPLDGGTRIAIVVYHTLTRLRPPNRHIHRVRGATSAQPKCEIILTLTTLVNRGTAWRSCNSRRLPYSCSCKGEWVAVCASAEIVIKLFVNVEKD